MRSPNKNRRQFQLNSCDLFKKRARRPSVMVLAAAGAVAFPAFAAAQDNWTGGGGANTNWSDASNWSLGEPANGNNVDIAPSTTSSFTVGYNMNGLSLGNLTLDRSNTNAADTLIMASNSLSAANDDVGISGAGAVEQSGGSNTATSFLYLGYNAGATGTYVLSGSGVLNDDFRERIGQGGLGIFNQSGGTNNVDGNLDLANLSTSTGQYTLNGTSVLGVSGIEYVGDGGTGSFAQSGGGNTAGTLVMANQAGSTGSYTLSGSASMLTVSGPEYVGYNSTASFSQSGGTNYLTNSSSGLYVGYNTASTGTYTLSNGSLSVAGSENVGYSGLGLFNQSGGTNVVNDGGSLYVGGSGPGGAGSYILSGTGSLMVSGSEWVGPGLIFNQPGSGSFSQSGGKNVVANELGVAAYGGIAAFTLSATGSLSANQEVVGQNGGIGSFVQSGGTNSVNESLDLATTEGSYGYYILSGTGTLTSPSVNAGTEGGDIGGGAGFVTVNGNGFLNVAGTVDVDFFNSGLTLTGGMINTAALDLNGVPTNFYWTAGTLTLSQSETFDPDASPSSTSAAFGAALTLSGDIFTNGAQTLNIQGNETLGGAAPFDLTILGGFYSGLNTVSGILTVDSHSTLTLANGFDTSVVLSVQGEELIGNSGTGALVQSGSVNNAFGGVQLGVNANSFGSYSLSAGILGAELSSGAEEIVGYGGTGVFNQSGGLNTTPGLSVGESVGSTGTYILSGSGTLTSTGLGNGSEYVGDFGIGTFVQSGGQNTITGYSDNYGNFADSLLVGTNAGSTGSYTLSGTGTLSSSYNEDIGQDGVGSFNQSGGANQANENIAIGNNVGATGTYTLSGSGSLAVANYEFVGYYGYGVFNQTGGTSQVEVLAGNGELDIAFNAGSTGTYFLSGGSLLVNGNTYVGGNEKGAGGVGTLAVSGTGQMTVDGNMTLYNGAVSATNEYVGGGSASDASIVVGPDSNIAGGVGAFIQTGGTNTAVNENVGDSNSFPIGDSPGSMGTYNQSGGLNIMGALNLRSGNLYLGSYTADYGAYNLSGGTLQLFNTMVVGNSGVGIVNQTGGAAYLGAEIPAQNYSGGLELAAESGSTGTYQISGGTLTVAEAVIGGTGTGSGGAGTLTIDGSGDVNSYDYVSIWPNNNSFIYLSGGTLAPAHMILEPLGGSAFYNDFVWTSGALIFTDESMTIDSVYHPEASFPFLSFGDSAGTTDSLPLIAGQTLEDYESECVGYMGSGTINQSGGTNTITNNPVTSTPGNLFVGCYGGSSGTYNLSGNGLLSVAGDEYLGYGGNGSFNQSGGTNDVSGNLYLGKNVGSTGMYALSGTGVLTASFDEFVGFQNVGSFNQSGGTNTLASGASDLAIGANAGANGLYMLSGGQLIITNGNVDVGGYNGIAGGLGTLQVLANGTMTVAGTLTVYDSSLNLAFSNVTQQGGEISAFIVADQCLYLQDNGTTNIDGALIVDDAGSATPGLAIYRISGASILNCSGNEIIGNTAVGTLNQFSGSNTISNNGVIAIGEEFGSTGSYSLSGTGILSCGQYEFVGDLGEGIFNQSGGANNTAILFLGTLGGATGAYTLSGSGALSPGELCVGDAGAGYFNQTAGTSTIDTLFVGQDLGAVGTVSLSNTASMSSFYEAAGLNGVGFFNQSGGTNAIGNELDVASNAGSSGTYLISGGSAIDNGSAYVGGSSSGAGGSGKLTVFNSGQLSVAGTLEVYNSGRVNLFVPTTNVGNLVIPGNTGIVDVNGTLNVNYVASGNSDPVASIFSYLKSGYNGGTWTGTGGIVSYSAATYVAEGQKTIMSVGYIDTGTQVVVKYAMAGDANLDGQINSADLLAVIQNFNKSGTDWAQGNFTYITSGASTTSQDLAYVIDNYGRTPLPPLPPPPSDTAVALGGTTIPLEESLAVQSNTSALPEPTSLTLFAAGAAGLLARRRRKLDRRTKSPSPI